MRRVLTAPIRDEDLQELHVGDYIYYTGILVTGRDDVHHRVITQGMPCPVDLEGQALFHAGPIVDESGGERRLVAVGPTSSIRMENEEAEFIKKTGVKIIIGKGAMGEKTAAACREHKAICCNFPGGCAVKASTCVDRIIDVKWRELGMPECMWVFDVKEFGPLTVTIDTYGTNLFDINRVYYLEQKQVVLQRLMDRINNMQR